MSSVVGGKATRTLWFLWQLPQHLAGLVLRWVLRAHISDVQHRGDQLVHYCFRRFGGVSLGRYVFVHREAVDDLVLHELGHCRQSGLLGPAYLLVIGLPSLLWASVYPLLLRFRPETDYFRFYTERWANSLAGIAVRRADRSDPADHSDGSPRT